MNHEPGDRPFFPQRWSCRLKRWPVNCPPKPNYPSLDLAARTWPGKSSLADRGADQWCHHLALARPGCPSPLATPQLDFPRDPQFEQKAARVLDLYQGCWQDQPLGSDEYVLSADEKTSIQARVRLHPTQPVEPTKPCEFEFEYERGGALAYLAAWDVRRAKIFGYCDPTTGIAPFDHLVQQVMSQEPYRQAKRVFWIVDNGSSHRGRPPASDCSRITPTSYWCICRFTPVGSTRWRSTSRSCRERCSRPTTFLASTRSPKGCWSFKNIRTSRQTV